MTKPTYDYYVVRVPAKYSRRAMKNYLTDAVRNWRISNAVPGLCDAPANTFKVAPLVTNLPPAVAEVIRALDAKVGIDQTARRHKDFVVRYLKGIFHDHPEIS